MHGAIFRGALLVFEQSPSGEARKLKQYVDWAGTALIAIARFYAGAGDAKLIEQVMESRKLFSEGFDKTTVLFDFNQRFAAAQGNDAARGEAVRMMFVDMVDSLVQSAASKLGTLGHLEKWHRASRCVIL